MISNQARSEVIMIVFILINISTKNNRRIEWLINAEVLQLFLAVVSSSNSHSTIIKQTFLCTFWTSPYLLFSCAENTLTNSFIPLFASKLHVIKIFETTSVAYPHTFNKFYKIRIAGDLSYLFSAHFYLPIKNEEFSLCIFLIIRKLSKV